MDIVQVKMDILANGLNIGYFGNKCKSAAPCFRNPANSDGATLE